MQEGLLLQREDGLHYYEVNTNKRMTFWPCITVPKMTFNIVHYSDKRMLIFLICKFMWFRLLLCHLLCTKSFFVSLSALWQKTRFFGLISSGKKRQFRLKNRHGWASSLLTQFLLSSLLTETHYSVLVLLFIWWSIILIIISTSPLLLWLDECVLTSLLSVFFYWNLQNFFAQKLCNTLIISWEILLITEKSFLLPHPSLTLSFDFTVTYLTPSQLLLVIPLEREMFH